MLRKNELPLTQWLNPIKKKKKNYHSASKDYTVHHLKDRLLSSVKLN